jgi:hypothetical protein
VKVALQEGAKFIIYVDLNLWYIIARQIHVRGIRLGKKDLLKIHVSEQLPERFRISPLRQGLYS